MDRFRVYASLLLALKICKTDCLIANHVHNSYQVSIFSLRRTRHNSRFLRELNVATVEPEFLNDVSPWAVAGVALLLGVSAQGFINSMISGDQGLGAFLSDGSGFQKSGFRPRKSSNKTNDAPLSGVDPLPWLKLPRFDFVEVAGQKNEISEKMEIESKIAGTQVTGIPSQDVVVKEKLESLAQELRIYLGNGDIERAEAVRDQIEFLMRKYGFEYNSES